VNIFDEQGHFLRVLGIPEEEAGCSDYTQLPSADQRAEDCSSYLGDYQPCVPGQKQPSSEIFNRRNICDGTTHNAESQSSSDEPTPPDAKSLPLTAPGGTPEAAPAGAAAQPEGPRAGVRSESPSSGTDKELMMMDYFLGQ